MWGRLRFDDSEKEDGAQGEKNKEREGDKVDDEDGKDDSEYDEKDNDVRIAQKLGESRYGLCYEVPAFANDINE